jgi:hypothetical protein
MAEISIDKPFSTNQLPSGFLKVPTPPIDGTPQSVEDLTGAISNLKLATDQSEFVSALEQCALLLRTSIVGSGVAFMDNTTTDEVQVGVGALGDILCFRAGGVIPMQLFSTSLTLLRNQLVNFTPRTGVGGSLVIDNSNNDFENSSVYIMNGATSIRFDQLFDGFNMSFIQNDATAPTFSVGVGSGYTLVNRQGHTQTAGQYAMVSVFFWNNIIYFGGDTA